MPATRDNGELPRCGAFQEPNGTTVWRVWAPRASEVELVLPDHSGRHVTVAMTREARGFFSCALREVADGQRYAFRLDGGRERPDPASRWQPEGVHEPSAVYFPEPFPWRDTEWKGVRREDLVIYEIHVGTFTPEGTFDAALRRLPDLRELGITAVELMPVSQFPGDRGWGYDGVHPFAVQNSYGGPQGLQQFVDVCHQSGIAVILDVVYNHLGPEGNYLNEFGPYFCPRYQTPWGQAVNFDDAGSDPVRSFVLENVRQWIRDFHIDGLRLDAVHTIYDSSPRHILREIKETAEAVAAHAGRTVVVIAESDLNDVSLLDPPERGGCGLDAQWSDDFHHAVHAHLTGEHAGYYADFGRPELLVKALNSTFVYDGQYSRARDRRHGAPAGEHPGDAFVVCIQNHDQVGNRARGERFGTLLSPAAQRLAAGLLLLAPHVPLLFMGEEYGESHPFPYFCSFLDPFLVEAVRSGRREEFAAFEWQGALPDPQSEQTFQAAKISWNWTGDADREALRRLYVDLIASRKASRPLRDFQNRRAELIDGPEGTLLCLVRGGGAERNVIWFNLSDVAVPLPADRMKDCRTLLWSEAEEYHGLRRPQTDRAALLPREFILTESC